MATRQVRSKRIWQGVNLIALIILTCFAILFWQRLQFPQSPQLLNTKQVVANQSEEPIKPIPLNISLDQNKVSLGEKLFQDVRLSGDKQISCLSCHSFSLGGTDRRVYSIGVNKIIGEINTPTVFNASFNFRLNWNGKFENLTEHLDRLLTNPQRMDVQWEESLQEFKKVPDYVKRFDQIYADGLTPNNIINALAIYVQSLYTPNARIDKFLRGDRQALTTVEKEGYQLFKAYGCVSCHQGINIGGNMFQRFGTLGDYFADRGNITPADFGRFNVTKDEADRYVFRVPSLRNVALTPPYFHDGSAQTLEQAIAIMTKYQLGRPLSKEQTNSIAQFLRTLTGEYEGKPL